MVSNYMEVGPYVRISQGKWVSRFPLAGDVPVEREKALMLETGYQLGRADERAAQPAQSDGYAVGFRPCRGCNKPVDRSSSFKWCDECRQKAQQPPAKALVVAAQAAYTHVLELAEAWRRGAIREDDGRGGLRSNRNHDVEIALRDALAAQPQQPPAPALVEAAQKLINYVNEPHRFVEALDDLRVALAALPATDSMNVWVLYEETGEYSDYSMGILGVFANPDAAKEYVAKICAEAVASHPSNYVYADRTPWEQDDDGDWHSEIDPKKHGSSRASWTINKRPLEGALPATDAATPAVMSMVVLTEADAEQRVAERIADWLSAHGIDLIEVVSYECGLDVDNLVSAIKAGAWRGTSDGGR